MASKLYEAALLDQPATNPELKLKDIKEKKEKQEALETHAPTNPAAKVKNNVKGTKKGNTNQYRDEEVDRDIELEENQKTHKEEIKKKKLTIGMVGQPNVGKSSVINQLKGEKVSFIYFILHCTFD